MVTRFICNGKVVLRKVDTFPLRIGDPIIIQEHASPYDETAYRIQDIMFVFSEAQKKSTYVRVYLKEITHPEELMQNENSIC